MIWISDISKLQYYNPSGAPCYCDQLIYASDLLLQGQLGTLATSGFSITVYLYTADGQTNLGDVTSYFQSYFALNPISGTKFFNLRLKAFAPAMCAQACYILRVVVTAAGSTIFDQYTERYCQASCCDVPREIILTQEGVSHRLTTPIGMDDPTGDAMPIEPAADPCAEKYITIRSTFSCYDVFTGEYYATPGTVYQDTASFQFEKRLNIVAKFVQRERDIKREISYNCFLQRSESFKPFVLQGISQTALVPTWKMNEIENMFHAEHIYINNYTDPETEYQFAGGKIFTRVHRCWESYRLDTVLQTCTQRQTFGCTPVCSPLNRLFFVIPGAYNGLGFYLENRQLIANSFDELLRWAQGLNEVSDVEDLSSDYPDAAGALSITAEAYIPTSFYYDSVTLRNKVYGVLVAPDVTATHAQCAKPVLGTLTVVDDTCVAPSLGTPIVTDQDDSFANISQVNAWTISDGGADAVTIFNGTGTFDLVVVNNTFPASGSPLTPVQFNGEIIGLISQTGRPKNALSLTHADNESIPEGNVLGIDTNGHITWYGAPTSYTTVYSRIVLTNIYYNI